MRIAFHAPLKPPDHPVPSGDRRMARLLIAALSAAGHAVTLASRFSNREGAGDPAAQERLAATGARLAECYLQRVRHHPEARPDLWFSYHLYYKAPDWIGPMIARALDIPYVIAEASLAQKRRSGPWDLGHRATEAALAQAAAVIGLNSADREGVLPALASPSRWIAFKPFLDRVPFDAALVERDATRSMLVRRWRLDPQQPWLVAAAMMRADVKLESYRVLGRALARCGDRPFQLLVVGDGPARGEVEAALAPLGSRVIFLGALDETAVPPVLAAADLCAWPAVGEAYGMALLEAQAAGLPVIAGRSGGVGDIVDSGITGLLTEAGDAAGFAAATQALLDDPARRVRFGRAARVKIAAEHDLAAAAARLEGLLRALVPASVP